MDRHRRMASKHSVSFSPARGAPASVRNKTGPAILTKRQEVKALQWRPSAAALKNRHG